MAAFTLLKDVNISGARVSGGNGWFDLAIGELMTSVLRLPKWLLPKLTSLLVP